MPVSTEGSDVPRPHKVTRKRVQITANHREAGYMCTRVQRCLSGAVLALEVSGAVLEIQCSRAVWSLEEAVGQSWFVWDSPNLRHL
jgi:hypothetical protein